MSADGHEGVILGAMVSGALKLSDVAHVPPEAFADLTMRRAFRALSAALVARSEGVRIPGVVGIDTAFACRACEAFGVSLGAVYSWREKDGRAVSMASGTLPDLARCAPRTPEARRALSTLGRAHRRREAAAKEARGDAAAFRATLAAYPQIQEAAARGEPIPEEATPGVVIALRLANRAVDRMGPI